MKILSRFKDYYDYIQGVYGIDEYLILDRTDFLSNYNPVYTKKLSIYIGRYMVDFLYDKDKDEYIFGDDLKKYEKTYKKKYSKYQNRWNKYTVNNLYGKDVDFVKFINSINRTEFILTEPLDLGDKSPTYKLECPILIDTCGNFKSPHLVKNPILKDFNIQSVFSAEQVWLEISRFLGELKTMKEKGIEVDDKTKIKSHGFDYKKSFRNMKRKD